MLYTSVLLITFCQLNPSLSLYESPRSFHPSKLLTILPLLNISDRRRKNLKDFLLQVLCKTRAKRSILLVPTCRKAADIGLSYRHEINKKKCYQIKPINYAIKNEFKEKIQSHCTQSSSLHLIFV